MYGSGELELWVQNDEGLYMEFMRQARRATYRSNDIFQEFMDENIYPFFLYTKEQEEELRESFESEVEELIKEEEEDSE